MTDPLMKILTAENPSFNLWLKGLVAVGSTLIVGTIPNAVEAASFTVEFAGSVNSLSGFSGVQAGEDVSQIGGPLDSVTTRNTRTPITNQDRIVGQYTFEDTTGNLLGSRFRFVAPTSEISLDPSVSDPSDIVFEPLPDLDPTSFENPVFRRTTASADVSSANYNRTVSDGRNLREFSNIFSVDEQSFAYTERGSALGDGGYLAETTGTIDFFSLVIDSEPETPTEPSVPSNPETPTEPPTMPNPNNPDSTSVPEPAAVIGLLTVAGLAGRRKTNCKA